MRKLNLLFYCLSLLTVTVLTVIGMALQNIITPIDQAFIYLMGVVWIAYRLGRGPSFLYSLLSVTAFNFFFVPPLYTFDVYDRSYWFTFLVMLMTSFVITEQASRLKLQINIAEQSKIEAETERLRSILLSSVSHDLRTPLASITGASSTILTDIDRLPRETIYDLSQSINTEAERLSHIVTNLLEATRFESDSVQLNRQLYFIEELIGAVLERLAPVLSKHIVVPKRDEDLPLVWADGILIEQVLSNLLENAAHYTPEGSIITVSAVQDGQAVLIKVADNGPGIPAGNEKKIFDKFYRIDNSEGPKGTGLGLAICMGIIKAHQGHIWVQSRQGKGSCFCFTLPIAEREDMTLKVSHG